MPHSSYTFLLPFLFIATATALLLAACGTAPTTPPVTSPETVPPVAQIAGIPFAVKDPDGTYHNLPGSPQSTASKEDRNKFFRGALFGGVDKAPAVPPGHVLPADQAADGWQSTSGSKLQWLGHSAFRWQIDGTTLLTDPLLTDRASPLPFAGPKRYVPSPLPPEEARADLILITHNHYDHLDLNTLKRLPNKDTVTVVVPAGVGPVVRSAGISHVVELSWGQQVQLHGLTITFVPTVHFSARSLTDRNQTLWGGYAVRGQHGNYYVGGDTAYHPTLFKEIGAALGPFTLALLPIGAYEPRTVMVGNHVNPEEAVQIGQDIRAKTLVGQHWGAIVLTTEPAFEPPVRFFAAAKKAGFDTNHTWIMAIGETRPLPTGLATPTGKAKAAK